MKNTFLVSLLFFLVMSCSKGPDKDLLKKEVQTKLNSFKSSLFTIKEFSRRGSYTYSDGGPHLLVYYKTTLKLVNDYKFSNWNQLGTGSFLSLLGANTGGVKGIKPEGNKAGDLITVYGSNNYKESEGEWKPTTIKIKGDSSSNKEKKYVNDLEAERDLEKSFQPAYQRHLERLKNLTKDIGKDAERLKEFENDLEDLVTIAEIEADITKDITGIATAQKGGDYYLFGRAIENILTTKADKIKSYSSFGSAHNIELVTSRKVTFGIAQGDLLKASFEQFKNIRAVMSLFPEAVHIVALKESNLTSINDLRGKKVSIGKRGSGSELNALDLMTAHGILRNDFKAYRYEVEEALNELKDKNIDAVIFTGAYPYNALAVFAGKTPIRLLKTDLSAKQKLAMQNFQIPKNTYTGQLESYSTLGTTAVLFTDESTNDQDVNYLLKNLFSKQEELSRSYSRTSDFSKENWEKGIEIQRHPAAMSFFQ